jgi:hypothetical protein
MESQDADLTAGRGRFLLDRRQAVAHDDDRPEVLP